MDQNNSYLYELVKKEDKDAFLISLYADTKYRDALISVFAFNCEIAKTREVVSETTIGLMRLLWWREAVQEIYKGNVRDNPVLKTLAKAIKEYDLPLKLFEDLTYAREFDLEDKIPESLKGLKNYCKFTNEPLFQLCSKIIGSDEDLEGLSINYGLIRLLKDFVKHAKQRRLYIPLDLLEAQNIKPDDIYAFKKQNELVTVIEDIVKEIFIEKPQAKFFKRYAKLTAMYKKQLEALNYNVLEYRWSLPPLLKELRLLF